MVETNPLKWFIRDIDIGDSGKSSSSAGKSVGKSGGGTGNAHFGVESPPQFSRHIRSDSETSSDMTPLISSRSSFNIHHDQTNSGKFDLSLILQKQGPG